MTATINRRDLLKAHAASLAAAAKKRREKRLGRSGRWALGEARRDMNCSVLLQVQLVFEGQNGFHLDLPHGLLSGCNYAADRAARQCEPAQARRDVTIPQQRHRFRRRLGPVNGLAMFPATI